MCADRYLNRSMDLIHEMWGFGQTSNNTVLQELRDKNDVLNREMYDVKQNLQAAQLDIDRNKDLQLTIDNLHIDLMVSRLKNVDLEDKNNSLKRENDSLREQIESLKAENSDFVLRLELQTKVTMNLRAQYDELSETNVKHVRALAQIRSQLESYDDNDNSNSAKQKMPAENVGNAKRLKSARGKLPVRMKMTAKKISEDVKQRQAQSTSKETLLYQVRDLDEISDAESGDVEITGVELASR